MSESDEPPMPFRDFLELLIHLDNEGRHRKRDSLIAQFVSEAPNWLVVYGKMKLSELYLEKGEFHKAIVAKNRAKVLWRSAKAMGIEAETEQIAAAAVLLDRLETVLEEAVPEEMKEECRAVVDEEVVGVAGGVNFDTEVCENGDTHPACGYEVAPDGGCQLNAPSAPETTVLGPVNLQL